MLDNVILLDWAAFAVRWLHVITAIAWIGSSFYFIALDLGLRRAAASPEGVTGEQWQVHGGGFYHLQKYNVAPAALPEHLVWFKWESYATWLSGFALLALLYYAGAELYLVDPNVRQLSSGTAILLSVSSLVVGWLAYDLACKSPLGRDNTRLMLALFVALTFAAWGYTQIFTGRAALLHVGALTATWMSANVFLVIIPNQKIVVADLRAGRTPDPKYGVIAKQRSTHNNYLTLPVIFLMLSTHYPLAFATPYNWLIASLVFLMGVTIRHYFNSVHAGRGRPHWTWAATAVVFAAIVALSMLPAREPAETIADVNAGRAVTAHLEAPGFDEAFRVVRTRCLMCHAEHAVWPGLNSRARAVKLDTETRVAAEARAIYLHSGVSHSMPPGNRSGMTAAERAVIRDWHAAGR